MDGTERDLFASSLRHAVESHTGEALDGALDELCWSDALAADPRAAVALLFEQQGAANATSSALDRVVLAALEVDAAVGAVVLPALGGGDPPGRLAGEALAVRGLGGGRLGRSDATIALVVASTGAGTVETVTVATAHLALRAVSGFDPALGLVEVTAHAVPVLPVAAGAAGGAGAASAWANAVAGGRRALGHEMVGAARSMLRLAREHALDRVQFGRPIGSFQAIRHRLADTLVAIEAADAALEAAWDDPSPVNAALAKALAGRGALTAARHCQQVLAGIGFTTEHPLHRHVRRVRVLDQLLGSARSLTRQLGDDLLATRRLLALLPL